MITTGKIVAINVSSAGFHNNKYTVELKLFQNPGDLDTRNYVFDANCSLPGGLSAAYNVGDLVYVDFINDGYSSPLIIGKIYQGISDEARAYAYFDTLKVDSKVELPKNTFIYDISYQKLNTLFQRVYDIENAKDLTHNLILTASAENQNYQYSFDCGATFAIIDSSGEIIGYDLNLLAKKIYEKYSTFSQPCFMKSDTSTQAYILSTCLHAEYESDNYKIKVYDSESDSFLLITGIVSDTLSK